MSIYFKMRALPMLLAGLLVAGQAQSIAIQIRNLDGVGEGFNDATLGASRLSAFQFAAGIWSGLLADSYAGETIVIDAQMDSMGGSSTSAILGSARAQYVWSSGGTAYADALANHLSGYDVGNAYFGASPAEIVATFNSDVDNATVLGTRSWYYGTDGNAGSNIDFISVVLHEIGHGLGLFSLIQSTGLYASGLGLPSIYDRFLSDANGTALTSMNQTQRAAAIVGGDLFWSGAKGNAANGGSPIELYAPNPYQSGSSVSHLDETTYPNELMSPYYSGVDHTPGDRFLGMLQDMGWTTVPSPASALLLGTGLIGLLGQRLGRRAKRKAD